MIARHTSRAGAAVLLALLALASLDCAGKKKEPKVEPAGPSAEEVYRQVQEQLQKRNLNNAIELIDSMQYTQESREDIEPLTRIALADATFYQGTDLSLIDARGLYMDFVNLYGDHPLAPYAQLQVGFCALKQMSDPAKDQSQAYQAIDDFEQIVRRWPRSTYAEAARDFLIVVSSNLAEHEFIVGKFYMKRKAWVAAADRFRTILRRFPDYVEIEKVLFQIGKALAKSGNPAEARIYLDQLIREYPDGEFVKRATQLIDSAADELREMGEGKG